MSKYRVTRFKRRCQYCRHRTRFVFRDAFFDFTCADRVACRHRRALRDAREADRARAADALNEERRRAVVARARVKDVS